MKKVLFVCTGNTCRSPMAEAIFNHLCDGNGFTATSCGIYGDGVSPISDGAKSALAEIGILSNHISTPISDKILSEADVIIGMTSNHAHSIITSYPQYAQKVFSMPSDITDPFGGDAGIYRACRNEIEKSIHVIITTLSGDNND